MKKATSSTHRLLRIIGAGIFVLIAAYGLLLIPEPYPAVPGTSEKQPFIWDQDDMWSALESRFAQASRDGGVQISPQIDSSIAYIHALLDTIAVDRLAPGDPLFHMLEEAIFQAGPMVAACTGQLARYNEVYSRMRRIIKWQSRHWEMNSPDARERIYRLLYGGRAAVEEVMLQAPSETVPSLILGYDEPSRTPAGEILNITVHSGDILISRGGAPTSALIARGNDFPGNFSHVALVHVDDRNGDISIIESHIEAGVVISSADDYLNDTKLRVMVLRLRADLPQLVADPLLPHQAARLALDSARARHIPYDFAMDFQDHCGLFCSEVASAPYEDLGLRLWMGLSHISSAGLRSWLAAFGVRYFKTQEPSDLEYDPQLCVVAEWHDRQRLYQDHIDNAVIDAMLETADAFPQLTYSWYKLPWARIGKAYSVLLNVFGKVGPVPEGMSAASALRNVAFSADHAALKRHLLRRADEFQQERGYVTPYWEMVRLVRQVQEERQK